MNSGLIFHQLFEKESSSFTYLLGDVPTRSAILIDPVLETVERDLSLLSELELELCYVVDTHVHADHITGAGELRKRTGARTAMSEAAGVPCADISLHDGEELNFGKSKLKILATPGHTNSCLSFLIGDRVFTGDALLIRGTGRTDFQHGSATKLYHSIMNVLYRLPDQTRVFPAHDYRGFSYSTIGLEKKFNPRIPASQSEAQFVRILNDLKLAQPKKIQQAVPANLACGKLS